MGENSLIMRIDIDSPTPLLGGMSPSAFMRDVWQRKPLLVRQAIPDFRPLFKRSALLGLLEREGLESRLVQLSSEGVWSFRAGPLTRRQLPPLTTPGWTVLLQGVDLHDEAAHRLLQRFRFVPDARLDDLMISFATDGGGVGPHFDRYDVFLLQASGRRRWRIGRQKDLRLREGLPLKILADFHPEHEWVLEPGDMLYLPPRYAHDGVAEGECMTYSVGFRAPTGGDLARDVLLRLSESDDAEGEGAVYRDAGQWAVSAPGVIPDALIEFARREVEKRLARPELLTQALGEVLTEPKPGVWFDAGEAMDGPAAISLDRRTRMMYAHGYVFINGESYRASGHDAALMQGLADEREMAQALWRQLSPQAQALVNEWVQSGWAYLSS